MMFLHAPHNLLKFQLHASIHTWVRLIKVKKKGTINENKNKNLMRMMMMMIKCFPVITERDEGSAVYVVYGSLHKFKGKKNFK